MNQLKNGRQYASNRGIWSTSVTNSAFLLAFVTKPIDSAHPCIMHTSLVLSAHAHNIEYYVLVKVVNNASGTRLAAATKADLLYRLRNVHAGYVLYRALVLLPRAHAQGIK